MAKLTRASARRRLSAWPLFGLSLISLVPSAAAALPGGGKVNSGTATITGSSSSTTITQSSNKAIIDWSSFSIGQGQTVSFQNGNGATLNRVLSGGITNIDGLLTATGSVYLINPSGVIIGKNGVVNVGGTFVASTQNVTDASFLAGGPLLFTGSSAAAVVNLGKIGALGGDVALIAAQVSNEGAITAPNGDVGLLSGYSVTLKDFADHDGKFAVEIGGSGTSVTNSGVIKAAAAELRANGGNIYALAGNTTGVVSASDVTMVGGVLRLVDADPGQAPTVDAPTPSLILAVTPGGQGGQILITSPGGSVSVAAGATLDASGRGSGSGGHILVDSASTAFNGTALARGGALGGDGGLVETSGDTLDFTGARVDTMAASGKTGTWMLDPYDLTVDAAGATAIQNGLATSNVLVQTTASSATSAYGTVNSSGSGDITIAAPITWSSGNSLTLDAYHSLHIDAAITDTGTTNGNIWLKATGGWLVLEADINAGSTNSILLESATVLGADTTLTASKVTAQSTVDGAHALAITGNAEFDGAVGASTSLSSLSISGTGAVDINTTGITTTGLQSYGGAVVFGSDSLLKSTGGGALTFTSTVDSDGTARAVTLTTSGLQTVLSV